MISARGLTHAFGDQPVLDRVDLDIPRGTTTACVGPSGCGKSTLLRVLAGLLRPQAGDVHVPAAQPGRPAVGVAFQDARLLPWLTVRQNLEFALAATGCPRAEWESRTSPLLESIGLAAAAHLRPHQLSGGMAQRIGVVRALVTRPHCVLLDEPFSALDRILRERLQDELRSLLQQAGAATLLVTHDVEEAVLLAEEVIVLSARPARVLDRVAVRRPRGLPSAVRSSASVNELAAHVRSALHGGSEADAARSKLSAFRVAQ